MGNVEGKKDIDGNELPIVINPSYFRLTDREKRIVIAQFLIFSSNEISRLEGAISDSSSS